MPSNWKAMKSGVVCAAKALLALPFAVAVTLTPDKAEAAETSRFSDEPRPFLSEGDLPPRTPPLLELGDAFLGQGNLAPGFELPTGAVWQPRLWVYGSGRSALQAYDRGPGTDVAEWRNRLDLFGNLQLTGTERVLVGVQPLHSDGSFSGYTLEPENSRTTTNELNLKIRTLFFEGDIAELFPRWDYIDATQNDIGFSIGRQGVIFQDGMLINDTIDAFGLTRNNVRFVGVPWLVNLRITGLFAWNDIDRDDNQDDRDARLYGLFTQWDTIPSTVNIDAVYVDSSTSEGDDVLVGAVDAIQRIGKFNLTGRVAASYAPDQKTPESDDGVLFFGEFSWTPPYTHNIAYINGFAGIDNFTSAARDPIAGGPLGRTGILFAARGIGTFPAPMSNRADEAVGAAVGYQMFFDNNRRQLILEAGARTDDSPGGFDAAGVAFRLQQAVGRRVVVTVDGFATGQEDNDEGYGLRSEFLVKF